MPATTPRYSFTYPIATDPTDIPDNVATFLDEIDAHVVMAYVGLLSARPAPSIFGRRYYASDQGKEYFDTGSQWLASGTVNTASGNISSSLPGDDASAGSTGLSADAGHVHTREPKGTVSDLQPSSQSGSFGSTGKWVDAGHSHPGDCIGDLKMSVTGNASVGWFVANGSQLSRTTYATFYNACGGTASYPWGQGDGVTTFNLPNFMDRVPIGAGSLYTVGQLTGVASVSLSISQLPTHSHGINQSIHGHPVSDPGHSHAYDLGGAVQFVTTAFPSTLTAGTGGQTVTYSNLDIHTAVTNIGVQGGLANISLQQTGGGNPVSLVQPSAGVIYLVKVQ